MLLVWLNNLGMGGSPGIEAVVLPSQPLILLDAKMNLDPILLDAQMGGDILLDADMNLDPILLDAKLDR